MAPTARARPHPLAGHAWRGLRIGLLGGSFNPAHGGHVHISRQAIRRLGLHQVWWLVAPQNPLKPRTGMAALEERLAGARRVAGDPRILVSDLEAQLASRYTSQTIAALRARFPATRFVWLMGADLVPQLPAWQRWTWLTESVPIAVFDRPSYSLIAQNAKFAVRYRHARLADRAARQLATCPPPAWTFLRIPRDPRSATALRAQGGRADRATGLKEDAG